VVLNLSHFKFSRDTTVVPAMHDVQKEAWELPERVAERLVLRVGSLSLTTMLCSSIFFNSHSGGWSLNGSIRHVGH
jgi:hypothetical protein